VRVLADKPVQVGFSTHDTWAEVAWIRVARNGRRIR
jgi:hypothetical protein